MAHRGALSPRRQGAASSFRVGKSDMEYFSDADYERAGAVHRPARGRSTLGYLIMVALEGLLSLQALRSAWSVAKPIMRDSSAAAFPVHSAMRSGAVLALGTPFFLLAFRCAIVALRRLGSSSRSGGAGAGGLQQPRLGFPLPAGLDDNAALDLYVIGLGAGVLGTCVPGLEVSGILLGRMLKECSAVWSVLALVVVVPGMYFSLGGLLSATAPAEGFVTHTRPTNAMWALCAAGHVILLCGCFYSPDVGRRVGFLLGLAHIMRLLQLAFSYPAGGATGAGVGVGVGACDEEIDGSEL